MEGGYQAVLCETVSFTLRIDFMGVYNLFCTYRNDEFTEIMSFFGLSKYYSRRTSINYKLNRYTISVLNY